MRRGRLWNRVWELGGFPGGRCMGSEKTSWSWRQGRVKSRPSGVGEGDIVVFNLSAVCLGLPSQICGAGGMRSACTAGSLWLAGDLCSPDRPGSVDHYVWPSGVSAQWAAVGEVWITGADKKKMVYLKKMMWKCVQVLLKRMTPTVLDFYN